MWEDEEEEEEAEDDEEDYEDLDHLQEEALDEALEAAEEERERQREIRLKEIMIKKEILIERYLLVAKVMISHRKKNIYLQDYLYHLAFRKGVLRGDPHYGQSSTATDSEDPAVKKRQQKKNTTMASRFARFLRKTGHFNDDDEGHQQRNPKNEPDLRIKKTRSHPKLNRKWSLHNRQFDKQLSKPYHNRDQRTQTKQKSKPGTSATPSGAKGSAKGKSGKKRDKARTLQEILEEKEAETLNRLMKTTDQGLQALEHHRCKLAKKKQLIRITKLLERQFKGTTVLDYERSHLVNFVETSVKAQNLAKRKALRRQQRHKSNTETKTGGANLNHQWTRSLERIRELRLKKARLEQEHRLVLLKRVKSWQIWESRNSKALEAVHEFVTKIASNMNMTRGETVTFNAGMEQFQKQLYVQHEAMLIQLVKMSKAKHTLAMTQRRAKDNASVAAPMVKGLTISDYQRMSIENHESHKKLAERHKHLHEQYEKLKVYIKRVAQSHLVKQRTWGALRTGRHDMKQLWELCTAERDSLLKKVHEVRRVHLIHKRLFVNISVLENKRIFKDYDKVRRGVDKLKDVQRYLQTELTKVQSLARVLSVKLADTQQRNQEQERTIEDNKHRNSLRFSRDTIQDRITPAPPNTIYNMNICCQKSQTRLIEHERRRSGGTPTNFEEFNPSTATTKLPRIRNKNIK